jgi:hypothetical protein
MLSAFNGYKPNYTQTAQFERIKKEKAPLTKYGLYNSGYTLLGVVINNHCCPLNAENRYKLIITI